MPHLLKLILPTCRKKLKLKSVTEKFRTLSTSAKLKDQNVLSSEKIRKKFIDFFSKNYDHLYVHSSPIILESDPSLLFVGAGMNQFKSIFLGTVPSQSPMASYQRVVNSQKCVRVGGKHNDLDAVGEDGSHHTFFEMLGNWSFGDYFKREACQMAWELLTGPFGIPKEKLFVTYFAGDEYLGLPPDLECRDIWLSIGIPGDRVLSFGMKDNFWDMGNTGPCGPCTEIHYVHGDVTADTKNLVNSNSPSVVEIWNLVFMQYERQSDGILKKLPIHHVDTGMGLERITAVLKGSESNYDTDLFQPLFTTIQKHAKIQPYSGLFGTHDKDGIDRAYRIIADHARMFTISITDGLIPDSVLAGHALRRIIWRAALLASTTLKCPVGVLGKLVPPIVELLGEAYPELYEKLPKIIEIVNEEEDKFVNQQKRSLAVLEKMVKKEGESQIFPGEKMLILHLSHGIPEEILLEAIKNKGLVPDTEGFNKLKELERKRAKQVSNMLLTQKSNFIDQDTFSTLKAKQLPMTDDSYKYIYEHRDSTYVFPSVTAEILFLWKENKCVDEIATGETGVVILDKTNFYADAGGQPSDFGEIILGDSVFEVENVKMSQGYIQHYGKTVTGSLKTSQLVDLKIDKNRRVASMKNHSACHIMHEALEKILGDVNPRSFYSGWDYFKMDITHQKLLTKDELERIEAYANAVIQKEQAVEVEMVSQNDKTFKNLNVKMIPGEPYPDPMRVIVITDTNFSSAEACCGTHVRNTRDIDLIVIVSQKSIGQMTRTIKAVSGSKALEVSSFTQKQVSLYQLLRHQFDEICAKDQDPPENLLLPIDKQLRLIRKRMSENFFALSMRDHLDEKLEKLQRDIRAVIRKKKKTQKSSI